MTLKRLAYGEPKKLNLPKGGGSGLIDGTSKVGFNIIRGLYFRAPRKAYEAARK